jgi:hypothetical protein
VFGPDGNLYVASFQTSSILEFDGTNGTFLRTLVSPGSGGLLNPSALIVSEGDLFVAGGASNDHDRPSRTIRNASPFDKSEGNHPSATEPGHGGPQIHGLRDSGREEAL